MSECGCEDLKPRIKQLEEEKKAPLAGEKAAAREAEEVSEPCADGSWLSRCPVCKTSELLPVQDKKLFGLVTLHWLECDCGAVFHAMGEQYRLVQISDESNPVWREYGEQNLTAREWKTIAHGGLSDAKLTEFERRPQKSRVDEAGTTYIQRQMSTAQRLQHEGLAIEKRWLTVGDDSVCEVCRSNGVSGWIPLDELFPSGHDAPLAHPGCRCDLLSRRIGAGQSTRQEPQA